MIDLPAAADRLVIRTGLVAISRLTLRARRLRWWPLVLLLVFPASAAVLEWGSTPFTRLSGYLAGALAFGAAGIVRLAGPIRTATIDLPLDERERAMRAQASALGHGIAAYWVALGFFYMALAAAMNLPRPHAPIEWSLLGLFQLTLFMLLPVLVASWRLSRPLDTDED